MKKNDAGKFKSKKSEKLSMKGRKGLTAGRNPVKKQERKTRILRTYCIKEEEGEE